MYFNTFHVLQFVCFLQQGEQSSKISATTNSCLSSTKNLKTKNTKTHTHTHTCTQMFLDISCITSSYDIIFFTSISTWKCLIDFIRTLCQVLVACNFPLFNIQYQKEKRKKTSRAWCIVWIV